MRKKDNSYNLQEKNNKILQYKELISKMIYSKNSKYHESKETTEEWITKITNDLKIQNGYFFNQILGSLDLIGDTIDAIDEFTDKGCSSYLNIYGVLNAIYLQKEAILILNKNFQLGNDKTIKENINNFKVLKIRHKIASHSVNYRNSNNEIEIYSISRTTMNYKEFTYYKFSFNNKKKEDINLFEHISEYLNYIINFLEDIILKLIKKIFNDGKKEEIYYSKTNTTKKQLIKTNLLNEFYHIKNDIEDEEKNDDENNNPYIEFECINCD